MAISSKHRSASERTAATSKPTKRRIEMDLIVVLTQDQYNRYKAAYQGVQGMETPPEDWQLVQQMKREASSITYAWEVNTNGANPETWVF